MATDPHGDVRQFYDFLGEQIRSGVPVTPESAIDQWRSEHPLDVLAEFDSEEEVAIIEMAQEALDDIAAGKKGMPIEEFQAEMRRRFNLK
ncbi:MAG: hypothetical protein C0483_20650 [Pirellula sp.]|nr:hypothetical protein [Pirellula sp.]